MRAFITLALLLLAAPAIADDLFSKTELRCEFKFGGKWNFIKHPPQLDPLPARSIRLHSIDLPAQNAHSGPKFDTPLSAFKGNRTITFVRKDVILTVFADEGMAGHPALYNNVEVDRAGFCR